MGTAISGPLPPRATAPREFHIAAERYRCLIRQEPARVAHWLGLLPGSAAEARFFKANEVRITACLVAINTGSGWNGTFDTAAIRSGVVRALLQAHRATLPATPPPRIFGREWYSGALAGEDPKHAPADVLAADIGLCVARSRWQDSAALVLAVDPDEERKQRGWTVRRSPADVREEERAGAVIDRLLPHVAACVPAGATVRLDRSGLRAIVEEAVYHLAVPQAGPG